MLYFQEGVRKDAMLCFEPAYFLHIWWLVSQLSGCLWLFAPKLWNVAGPMNCILPFYECRFSGGDTMRWWGHSNPTLCKRICFNFFTHAVTGHKNSGGREPKSHHCGTFTFNIFE